LHLFIFFNLPFPLIVLTAAIIGYLASKKYPTLFTGGSSHQQSKKDYGSAIIDDDTPTPEHAIFSWKHLGRYFLSGRYYGLSQSSV
jgi:chromate transporter